MQQEPSTVQKSRYPRPTWFVLARGLLLLAGLVNGPLYILLLCQALIRHTLHTVDHTLLDPTNIILFAFLTVGGIWALYDAMREDRFLRQQRRAEWSLPWEVQTERRWRNDLALARTKHDRHAEAIALHNIGFWIREQERPTEAEPYLKESLVLAREVNDRYQEERILCDLGKCAHDRGNMDEAEALYRQSLAVTLSLTPEQMPTRRIPMIALLEEVADNYALLGQFLAEQRGKPVEGCQMLTEAEAHYREMARTHEQEAQKYRVNRWRRTSEVRMSHINMEDAEHMRELQQKYGTKSE